MLITSDPAPTKLYDPMDYVRTAFFNEISEHKLTVLKDDGLYRHLRCRKPGTIMYGWDITTWPGHLAVTGDLGSFTFTREQDMLVDFFHGLGRTIDVRYWLEKCIAWDSNTSPRGVVCKQYVQRHFEQELNTDDIDPESPRGQAWGAVLQLAEELNETNRVNEVLEALMENIDSDAWDWPITKPDYRSLMVCLMIAWTHDRYREHLARQVGSSV